MSDAEYRPGPIVGVSEEVMACIPHTGILHAYVWWASQTTHAPAWWHVGAGLTVLAHEAARWGYTIGTDQAMKPLLWVALLGPSAAGKSTAISRAVDLYRDHLTALSAPDPWVMAEGSIPGIFEKLTEGWDADIGRTVGILYQEEFSRLLDRNDTVSEMLMQLVDGKDIERHLRGNRQAAKQGQAVNDKLVNPCISALFATTYSSLRRVTHGNHLDGGLYSRLLWFVADPDLANLQMLPTKRAAERRVVMHEWQEWGGWLLAESALGAPRVVNVPREIYWILEESLFATAKARFSNDDRLNATRMRGIIQAYQIAGLFALSQGRTCVVSDDMDAAVNLVEKCGAGLERVDPELGNSEIMQSVNIAFRSIQTTGTAGLKRNELYNVLKTNKRTVDEVLSTLTDEGSIRECRVKTGKRGRPAIVYVACGPKRYQGSDNPPDGVQALHKAPQRPSS